jgi:hypothetical protein
MLAPELFPKISKLLKEDIRTDAFQLLDNCSDVLMRSVGNEKVHMVACNLAGNDVQFIFNGGLMNYIIHINSNMAD